MNNQEDLCKKLAKYIFTAYKKKVVTCSITEIMEQIENECCKLADSGNKSELAEFYKIKRTTLLYRMKKHV